MKLFITKTRFLGLLGCLLPLSVSAGELDGKSLVCDRVNSDSVFGFRFEKGRVKTDFLSDTQFVKKENGEMDVIRGNYTISKDSLFILGNNSYVADRTEVRWGDNTLNRQTLELIESKSSSKPWQCEVFSNDDDYWKQLENIRTQKQNKADEEKSKNKI